MFRFEFIGRKTDLLLSCYSDQSGASTLERKFMAKNDSWITIPLSLVGPLDTRSRPADLGPSAIRWKLNLGVNKSGKLTRRAGHSALSFGLRSDSPSSVSNWDLHRRGAVREPITLLSEIVSPDRARYLFAGTQSRVDWLDNATSEWVTIISGLLSAPQSRWKAAGLRTKVVLTNNVDQPQIHELGSATTATIPDLIAQGVTKAKVVVQYQNVMILMNVVEDGVSIPNRIWWSDFRDAEVWTPSASTTAGFLDLDDGEEILACAELAGLLYIFTDRAIWQMFPNVTDNSIFGLRRWYSDPVSRNASLKYENSLVATGRELYWLGADTAYTCNQFSSAPSSPDFILKATGRMFEGPERLDSTFCAAPVGAFVPDAAGASKEVWWSYPRIGGEDGINDYSMVLSFNIDSQSSPWQTADYCDHGYTAFVNFTHTLAGVTCATTATFIGASGADYCLKSVGGVFYRQMVTLLTGGVTTDIPDVSYLRTQSGYFSEMRGTFPLPPLSTRKKIIRRVQLEHDTVDPLGPTSNVLQLKIGNSYIIADPLASNCGVLWHPLEDKPLACPNLKTAEQLLADGQRSDDATEWFAAEQGIYLHYWITVAGYQGAPPIGSDSAFNNLAVDYLLLP
jgi:hypothetical protein